MYVCGWVDRRMDRQTDRGNAKIITANQNQLLLPSVLPGAVPRNALECPHARLWTVTGLLTDPRDLVLLVNNLLQK